MADSMSFDGYIKQQPDGISPNESRWSIGDRWVLVPCKECSVPKGAPCRHEQADERVITVCDTRIASAERWLKKEKILMGNAIVGHDLELIVGGLMFGPWLDGSPECAQQALEIARVISAAQEMRYSMVDRIRGECSHEVQLATNRRRAAECALEGLRYAANRLFKCPRCGARPGKSCRHGVAHKARRMLVEDRLNAR